MTESLIKPNSLARAAERVRAQREAERANPTEKVQEATPLHPPRTTSQVRARLNFIPDAEALNTIIGNAVAALSRGVRWARGSILNLLV